MVMMRSRTSEVTLHLSGRSFGGRAKGQGRASATAGQVISKRGCDSFSLAASLIQVSTVGRLETLHDKVLHAVLENLKQWYTSGARDASGELFDAAQTKCLCIAFLEKCQ